MKVSNLVVSVLALGFTTACSNESASLRGADSDRAIGVVVNQRLAPPATCYSLPTLSGSADVTPEINAAVSAHGCVILPKGDYLIGTQIVIFSQQSLYGNALGTTLHANQSTWKLTPADGMVNFPDVNTQNASVANLHLDGAGVATYDVAGAGYTADNVEMYNARCGGAGIGGARVRIQNSSIHDNAWPNTKPGVTCATEGGVIEGAGIYAEGAGATFNGMKYTVGTTLSPVITANTITHNYGPGLDINAVWGGTLTNNTFTNNQSWAGVSLYGASNWTITGNHISQPSTNIGQPYHHECSGGSNGAGSAAIMICEDADTAPGINAQPYNHIASYNLVSGNALSGFYGILLIGNDDDPINYSQHPNPNDPFHPAPYRVPRFNTITNNNVIGSNVGCADDFVPGQWSDGANSWSGNNCQGSANSAPNYF